MRTKFNFSVAAYEEEFDYQDMGFDLKGWEYLSEDEKQDAAEEYAQELFDSIGYNLEHQ